MKRAAQHNSPGNLVYNMRSDDKIERISKGINMVIIKIPVSLYVMIRIGILGCSAATF